MRAKETTKDLTTEHDVMVCPAYGSAIKAIVTIRAEFGMPTLKAGGAEVDLPVKGVVRTFSLRHDCHGAVEDVYPAEEMGQ